MCRWLAYRGSPVVAEMLVTLPEHSLIDQSMASVHLTDPYYPKSAPKRKHDYPTQGEGFGLGWVGKDGKVGRFRSTAPAWNSINLRSIASQVESGTILAHVRADPGGTTSEQNCHPFVHGKWMFQHNGTVGGFRKLKRELTFEVDPDLYPCILGNTDTEVLFYLALTYGLEDDPEGALRKLVDRVERARKENGITAAFRATIAASDGNTLWVMRTSSTENVDGSNHPSPSLFYTTGPRTLRMEDGSEQTLPDDAALVTSEPLSQAAGDVACQPVPDHTIARFTPGEEPVFMPLTREVVAREVVETV